MAEGVEITDRDSARAWLETQNHQTQFWFACRCALRSLPALGYWSDATTNGVAFEAFKNTLLAAASSKSTPDGLRADIDKANAVTGRIGTAATGPPGAQSAALSTHGAVTCLVEGSTTNAVSQSAAAASNFVDALIFTADPQAYTENSEGLEDEFEDAAYAEMSRDANASNGWGTLWAQGTPPEVMAKGWSTLKEQLGADWSFWIEWYEAIIKGTPLPWELSQRVALQITEEEWEAGQATVGPRILEIRAAYEVEVLAKEVANTAYLAQRGTPGIGHNEPPSLIDEDLPAQEPETLIWVAASSLHDEASSEKPQKAKVQKAVGILIAALQVSGLWVAQKLDKAITEAVTAFSRTLVTAAGVSFLAFITGHSDKIIQLVEKVLSWLPLVG